MSFFRNILKSRRTIFLLIIFLLLIIAPVIEDKIQSIIMKNELGNLSQPDIVPYLIPDFKKWPIEKEGNVDADNDGKEDFKIVYYMKEKEDAVALFVPIDKSPPAFLIFARYKNNIADPFGIIFGIYENGKWERILYPFEDPRVNREFEKLNIKMRPTELHLSAFLSGFNRRSEFLDESGKKRFKI